MLNPEYLHRNYTQGCNYTFLSMGISLKLASFWPEGCLAEFHTPAFNIKSSFSRCLWCFMERCKAAYFEVVSNQLIKLVSCGVSLSLVTIPPHLPVFLCTKCPLVKKEVGIIYYHSSQTIIGQKH